jgi:hypothetical protein
MKNKKAKKFFLPLFILLLVSGCTDKDEVIDLAKEATRISFEMGYDCANENKSKDECLLELEKQLSKVNN